MQTPFCTPQRLPCPYLPACDADMNYRALSAHRHGDSAKLYHAALRYGQFLWCRGETARAILAVNRCLHAAIPVTLTELPGWPLPYRALRWVFQNHPGDSFMGNPRISFQHQALRLKGPRQEIRRWRCWAVWHLARIELPELPDDPTCTAGPEKEAIMQALETFGLPDEAKMWTESMQSAINFD